MSPTVQKVLAIGGGVLLLAIGAFFLLGNRDGDGGFAIPGITDEPPVCPLSGVEAKNESLVERPAVAVKIENNSSAYPLAGLNDAEIVYEELVEGGLTRFLALFHCTDSAQAGPVRSSREIDPGIMGPITKILAAAGGNDQVRGVLDEAGIVLVDEDTAGDAMQRVERSGISFEHTLYANTKALRKIGGKKHEDAPPEDLFEFGDFDAKGKKARTITMSFGASTITYEWNGDGWLRMDDGTPLPVEDGEVVVENVVIEEHDYEYSGISDVVGAQSVDIVDKTGSGRAVLFRDGKAYQGTWERESEDDPVTFLTKDGEEMVFAPGSIWIELIPNDKGDAKGSFSFEKS